ncbi:MAG: ABC transporter ATP-binding protein [Flavobacteriales bacterium]
MPTPVLKLEQLNISFGEKQVLQDFSLTIYPGQSLAVVGESGSGKSVGALLSMGLLDPKAEVQAKTADLLGRSISSMTPALWSEIRGKEVAMVFQDPMTSLHPSIRIGTQLDEVLERHTSASAGERKRKILEALAEVELPEPEHTYSKYPHELSGGQRQRVVIAMALLLDPKLIIADEPTTALDKAVEATILTLLRNLVKERGCALWLISHDLEVVSEHADDVLVLFRGKTVEQGPAKDIFEHPQHAYTKGLLACRPPKKGRPYPLPVLQDFLEEKGAVEKEELVAPKANDPLLKIEGLTIGFQRKKGWRKHTQWVVRDQDLALMPGETLGLIGPSGSGKSTIGRAIVGLNTHQYKHWNYSGDRSKIQFIFQDPYSALNSGKRIGWALDQVLRKHQSHLSAAERLSKAEALMEEVGLQASDLQKKPSAFSGGQRQRIGIARALAADPELLICDESVSALDVSVQAQVLNLLNGIKKNRGLSMIFISHDPDVVRYMCDRIIALEPLAS